VTYSADGEIRSDDEISSDEEDAHSRHWVNDMPDSDLPVEPEQLHNLLAQQHAKRPMPSRPTVFLVMRQPKALIL
jgi:hypothetical protein